MNNSCSPFVDADSICALGNLAVYAVNVSDAEDVKAGIQFTQDHNIRLTVKNTGHDFLGRSAGAGSLELWMHNLQVLTFLNYSSSFYSGPAVRVGAGVEYSTVLQEANTRSLRVVGGSCPTIGVAGGFTQGGGHGPLGAAYGLSADQVLEWEVITAAGSHITVSPTDDADLFWALSGGGPGNFAVVLSMTVRAYNDGPVAGAGFIFANNGNDTAYWAAITTWVRRVIEFDAIQGLTTVWAFTSAGFELQFATLPDVQSTIDLDTAMAPFLDELAKLDVLIASGYNSTIHGTFADHYDAWATHEWTSNISVGGRLIPRSAVDNENKLINLISVFRNITDQGGEILAVAANVSSKQDTPNAVLPAWRDALFTMSFAKPISETAEWDTLRETQTQLNIWQDEVRSVTLGGGTYVNEATWDNSNWKEDYFGSNYQALSQVKQKFDPYHVFWVNAAAGSDIYWKTAEDGRLCRT